MFQTVGRCVDENVSMHVGVEEARLSVQKHTCSTEAALFYVSLRNGRRKIRMEFIN